MRVRLWGVRGSVPWASALCIGHGCNTPCVEVTASDGRRLTLDAGSGIVGLNDVLPRDRTEASVLLTHFHWDHIQGLPFFAPFYQPGVTATIWAPNLKTIEDGWMETIFKSPFFPVPYDHLPSRPSITLLDAGTHTIEGFAIRTTRLNHPGGAFAYRITGDTGDLVYATDHEFGNPEIDEALEDFAAGARLLIIDSHFTPSEIGAYKGWGHSDWATCATFAARANVDRLWLFHHKPGRTDVELTEIEADARRIFSNTDAAGEGDTIDI